MNARGWAYLLTYCAVIGGPAYLLMAGPAWLGAALGVPGCVGLYVGMMRAQC